VFVPEHVHSIRLRLPNYCVSGDQFRLLTGWWLEGSAVAGNSTTHGRSVTDKVIAILMAFSQGSVHSLTEIAAEAAIPLPTAHRLVGELTACRLLDRTMDGHYQPGVAIRDLGTVPPSMPTLEERGPWVLEDLSMATGTLVRLGRLDTDSMTVAYIEKKPGRRPVSDFHPAARLPAHACASGKILLAFAPPEIPELVISRGLRAYTSSTLTRPDQFRKSLATTRLTGIGVCCAELRDDSYAVAIPVSDWWGSVIAAMEMTAHDPFTLRTYSPVLAVAARCLSRELGYEPAASVEVV
jgi:IclR family acetate operon transcriptional repressor